MLRRTLLALSAAGLALFALGCGPSTPNCGPGLVAQGSTCVPKNECMDRTAQCGANTQCEDRAPEDGGYACLCNTGYEPDPLVPGTCRNINECLLGTDDCDVNADCTDTSPRWTCQCRPGYVLNGTSCVPCSAACGANATCTGQNQCTCSPGYTGNPLTGCTDIDECAANTDNCDANARCANMPGSFSCTCNAGFAGGGTSCSDVNECNTVTTCGANAAAGQCTNTVGGYDCTCSAGYVRSGSGSTLTCVDVNECGDTTKCGFATGGGSCANTSGGYTCTCATGYTLTGSGLTATCVDVNECATNGDNCAADATCTNGAGGFTCACNPGYQGDGTSCVDVNECLVANGGCDANATCTNTDGSRTCACNAGYLGSGSACSPVDCGTLAAPTDGIVDAPATTFGTTAMFSCRAGYRLVGASTRTCLASGSWSGASPTCSDVDECAEDLDDCAAQATCSNSVGSFSCACDDGWTGNGRTCLDVDECLTDNGSCPTGAACTNTVGSRLCACPVGTTECSGECVDTDVDPTHCGGCGMALGAMQYCAEGTPVTTPIVSAVPTVLAEAGQRVVLEGTFGATSSVTIAGVSATTVGRGAGRLEVTVPASSGAGNIVVTTGGRSSTYGSFRRVGYSLGIDEFRSEYEQEAYGRQMPYLNTPRTHAATVATDTFWYVVGGAGSTGPLSSVERAMINADGTVGGFQPAGISLATARTAASGVRVGDAFYVLGGVGAAGAVSTVERATISNGILSSFTTVATSLTRPRSHAAALVVGGYLYVIGGAADPEGATTSIERAPILAGGTLGAFEVYEHSLTQSRIAPVVFANATHLFVVGGFAGGSTYRATADVAPLTHIEAGVAVGNVSKPLGFSAISIGGGFTGRADASLVRIGSRQFLLGGRQSTGVLANVDELFVGGTLTAPTLSIAGSGTTLSTARANVHAVTSPASNHVYVAGGTDAGGTELKSVERAAINVSGALAARTTLSNLVGSSTRAYTTRSFAAVGRYLYLIGGGSNGDGVCQSGPFEVRRWQVSLDGTLGPVEALPVSVGGLSGAVFVTTRDVCVAPGRQGVSADTSNVYCATYESDGSLGAFVTTTSSFPMGGFPLVIVVAERAYAFSTGSLDASVRAAPIADGALGAFAPTGFTQPAPTIAYAYGAPVLVGNDFYGLGGQGAATPIGRVDYFAFDGSGAIASTPVSLSSAGGVVDIVPATVMVGPNFYAFGGGSPPRTSARVAELVNGTPPSLSAAPVTLATGRHGAAAMALGNFAYVVGGYDGVTQCNQYVGSSPDAERFELR